MTNFNLVNNYNLNDKQIAEINEVHWKNLDGMFGQNKGEWIELRDKDASRYFNVSEKKLGKMSENEKELVEYLIKLQGQSGLDPKGKKVEEYIMQAQLKATHDKRALVIWKGSDTPAPKPDTQPGESGEGEWKDAQPAGKQVKPNAGGQWQDAKSSVSPKSSGSKDDEWQDAKSSDKSGKVDMEENGGWQDAKGIKKGETKNDDNWEDAKSKNTSKPKTQNEEWQDAKPSGGN